MPTLDAHSDWPAEFFDGVGVVRNEKEAEALVLRRVRAVHRVDGEPQLVHGLEARAAITYGISLF